VITDALLTYFAALVESMVSLLPSMASPWDVVGTAGAIAKYTAPLDDVVPFFAPLNVLIKVVAVTFPALFAYRVGLWLYKRIRG